MADLPWGALSGFAAGFPDTTDLIPFERVTGTTRTPSGNTYDKLFQVDIRMFGPLNANGTTSDTTTVKAALDAIQGVTFSGAYRGRELYIPAGDYFLPSWGTYKQTGPIRIRAEQGAIFRGNVTGASNAEVWKVQPGTANGDYNFLWFDHIAALGPQLDSSPFGTRERIATPSELPVGPVLDIEGLTFINWTRVFYGQLNWDYICPLFRLHRCHFENVYRGISMWDGSPGLFDRIEITYNKFYKCNIALEFSGGRWQNAIVHANFVDFCAREGIRFGTNSAWIPGHNTSNPADPYGLQEQTLWSRIIFSYNMITRIGQTAFLPGMNECHALRDYSHFVEYIGNICWDINGVAGSNDAETVYTKARYAIAINNILISPNGGGDSRGLFVKKGQNRMWDYNQAPPQQTNSFSNIFSNNIFLFEGEERGVAFFSEGGDHLIVNNWFEQCGNSTSSAGLIHHGSNDIGNLDMVIVVQSNVFRHCTGWLVGGSLAGGTVYIDDNIVNSGVNANEKHTGLVTMQGMGFTPAVFDPVPGFVVDPSWISRGTTYYIRRNTGDAGTQADVWCKADQEAYSLTAIVEGNNLTGVVSLVGTSNNAMARVDIINNDLNGSNLNTARLIDIGSSNLAPRQLRICGNRGFKRTTTTTATIFVQRFIMPPQAVGFVKYRLLGRDNASSANAYYAEVTRGIFANGLFGATENRIEMAQGSVMTTTPNHATITQSGANVDINIVGGTAGPTIVWDVDIDAYYDAP